MNHNWFYFFLIMENTIKTFTRSKFRNQLKKKNGFFRIFFFERERIERKKDRKQREIVKKNEPDTGSRLLWLPFSSHPKSFWEASQRNKIILSRKKPLGNPTVFFFFISPKKMKNFIVFGTKKNRQQNQHVFESHFGFEENKTILCV
jgi:hypothetical protein